MPTPIRRIVFIVSLFSLLFWSASWSSTRTVPLSGVPTAVAALQENNRVYISFGNGIGIFDPSTLSQVGSIPLGSDAVGFSFDPVWRTLFAPSGTLGVVSLVDVGSATVPVLIPLEAVPGVTAINSTTQRLYVALPSENKLKIVNMSKTPFAFESDVKLPSAPTALLVDAVSNSVIIGLANGAITVLDGQDHTLFGSQQFGGTIRQIVAGTFTEPKLKGQIYVITDTQLVVLTGTNPFVIGAQLAIPGNPSAVAMNPATGTLFVTERDNNSVAVIDAFTDTISSTVPVIHEPTGIAVVTSNGSLAPGEHTVFVTGAVDSAVSVFSDPAIGKDIITIPVRWCAMEGSVAANGTLVPDGQSFTGGNAATDETLLSQLRIATTEVWINNSDSHISFRAALADHFPIVADPNRFVPLGEVELGLNNGDLTGAWANCEQAWATLFPGQVGTIALNVQNFESAQAGVTPGPTSLTVGQPNSSALCVAPRTLTTSDVNPQLMVAVADPSEYFGRISQKGNRPGLFQTTDATASGVTLAHELGHSLLLGHGDGIDNNHDGTLPPPPGPRKYDGYCDPLGVDGNDSPIEDTMGAPPPGCPSVMVWAGTCRTLRPLQVETARDTALLVPGRVVFNGLDPSGTIVAPRKKRTTGGRTSSEIELASVTLSQTPSRATTEVAARLSGRMQSGQLYEYVFFVDADGNPGTGCQYIPGGSRDKFEGGEILIHVRARAPDPEKSMETASTIELCQDGRFQPVAADGITSFAYNISLLGQPAPWAEVASVIPNRILWRSLRAVRVAAFVLVDDRLAAPSLPITGPDGAFASLLPPQLPTCSVSRASASTGQSVMIEGDQLPSKQPVDVFIGNDLVGNATSDAYGRASIGLTIASNQSAGLKQVSMVAHGTARTATCALYIVGPRISIPPPWLWVAAQVTGRIARPRIGQLVTVTMDARKDPSISVNRAPIELTFDPRVLELVASSVVPKKAELGRLLWEVLGRGQRRSESGSSLRGDITFRVVHCDREQQTTVSISSHGAMSESGDLLPTIQTSKTVPLMCRPSQKGSPE